MAKAANSRTYDALLNFVATATQMNANSAEPTTKTEADTTFMLANVVPTFGSPAAGGGGRQIECEAKASVANVNAGVANHVSLTDATDIIVVTTVTSPPTLDVPGTVNFGAWNTIVLDPV